jgi:hypothetical protein
MSDRTRISIGLGIFLLLGAYPAWSGLRSTSAAGRPELESARDSSGCVEDTLFMRANHAILLNRWREDVVRGGESTWRAASGATFEMSLTGTCLGCHADCDAFCERCHGWASVRLTCWNCHVQPEGS